MSAAWDPLIVGENRRVRLKENDKNAERNFSDDDLIRRHYDDGEFWVAHIVVDIVLRLYLTYVTLLISFVICTICRVGFGGWFVQSHDHY